MAPVIRTSYASRVHAKKYSTSFKWNLEEYSTLQHFYGNFIESPDFELVQSDKKCSIGFLHGDDDVAYARVYFPQGIEFQTLKIAISIVDEDERKIVERYSIVDKPPKVDEMTPYNTFEHSLFLSSENKSYLHNDTLSLFCEVTIIKCVNKSSIETIDQERRSEDCRREKFEEYFESSSLCDITFIVDGTKLHAHKVILAASSPVFEAMFSTEMTEQLKNTVTITDTDAATFEAFLKCLYAESVLKMDKHISQLLILSDKYQVVGMRELCENYIKNCLDSSNAIDYLLLAHVHGFENLKRRALLVVTLYQKELADSADFGKLCKYPELVGEIFRKVTE